MKNARHKRHIYWWGDRKADRSNGKRGRLKREAQKEIRAAERTRP